MPKLSQRDKRTLIKGILIGVLAGAVLPDSVNPVVIVGKVVKPMLDKAGEGV